MIVRLRGLVLEHDGRTIVVEAGGVGYQATATAGALRALPPPGAEVVLHVHQHFTADGGPQLFAFADTVERRLFQTLITVKNIGPKAAVNILSNVQAPELVRAIVSGDVERLSAVKGIGRKTAERLCVELRDSIAAAAAGARKESAAARAAAPPQPLLDERLREVAAYLDALQLRPDEYGAILPGLDPARALPDLVKDVLARLREARPGPR